MDIIAIIDFMDLKDLKDLKALEPPRRPIKQRVRINPFALLSDEDFRSKYTFSKAFGLEVLDLIKEDLLYDPRGNPISLELQVACALRSWTCNENQDDAADLHGISQPAL